MRNVVAYRIPFIHDLVSKYASQGWGVRRGRHSRAGVGPPREFAAPGPHIMSEAWQVTGTAHSAVNEKQQRKQRLS